MLDVNGFGLDKLRADVAKNLADRLQQALFGGSDVFNLLVKYVENTGALLNKMEKEHRKLSQALSDLKNKKFAKTKTVAKKTKTKKTKTVDSGKRLPSKADVLDVIKQPRARWERKPADPSKETVTLDQSPRRKLSKAA